MHKVLGASIAFLLLLSDALLSTARCPRTQPVKVNSIAKVDIEWWSDLDGDKPPLSITVTDQKTIAELLRFFPELRSGKRPGPAGSWIARYWFVFKSDNGDEFGVAVSAGLDFWCEPGRTSDWPLKDATGFRKRMNELFKDKKK
jgi:hypothetical protein